MSLAVHAVVVNWNGGSANLECLASLLAAGVEGPRIVFVDNASSDGSAERVGERFPDVVRIDNDANLGFGEAANRGARRALESGAGAVLFVNNDATVPPETLPRLAEVLEADPDVGIVGPRVLFARDPTRVWCAGGMLTWRENLSTLLGHGQLDGVAWRGRRDVDYVAGCVMLVRRAVFAEIGFFEPRYFAYMEDVEFCLRARRAGFRVLTVGEVAAMHDPSSATGGGYNPRRKYLQGVNSVHFLRRHGGASQWARFVVFDVASLPVLLVAAPFRGRTRAVLAKGLGIAHGMAGRWVRGRDLEAGGTGLW